MEEVCFLWGFAIFTKKDDPAVQGPFGRTLPTNDPCGGFSKEQFKGLGGKPPIVGGIVVDVKIKRGANEGDSLGGKDPFHFRGGLPKLGHMFQTTHGNEGRNGTIGKGKGLGIALYIDTGALSKIQPQYLFSREKGAKVTKGFLALDKKSANIQHGTLTLPSLGNRFHQAMEKVVHWGTNTSTKKAKAYALTLGCCTDFGESCPIPARLPRFV